MCLSFPLAAGFHFYPRSPCGERHGAVSVLHDALSISIHALLAESDVIREPTAMGDDKFLSTLSLRRATLSSGYMFDESMRFLSTLSLRRATCRAGISESRYKHFYPRSPCGERLHYDNYNLHCVEISIHALLAESDSRPKALKSRRMVFLSTLSLRRATRAFRLADMSNA